MCILRTYLSFCASQTVSDSLKRFFIYYLFVCLFVCCLFTSTYSLAICFTCSEQGRQRRETSSRSRTRAMSTRCCNGLQYHHLRQTRRAL